MEKIIKKELRRLRDSLEFAADNRAYDSALRLEGAIFHIEMLYDKLRHAGHICTTEFKEGDENGCSR